MPPSDRGYRGLGFDPTPGDVDSVAQASAQLRRAAEHLAAAEPAVRRALDAAGQWRGAGADAFRGHLAGVPESLAERPAAVRDAATTLEGWAQTLAANKRRTEELDRPAVRLRGALDAARDDLQDKQNALDLASTPSVAAGASVAATAAATRVADLERRLSEVLQQAHDLAREHRAAADRIADTLTGTPSGDDVAVSAFGRSLNGALRRGRDVASTMAAALGGQPQRPARVPTGAAARLAAILDGPS